MTLILTRRDVDSVLSLRDCIEAVENVFREYGEQRIAPPQSLGLPAESGVFHIKAALAGQFVAKINANFPGNPRRYGLPTIQGVIVLMDSGHGTPLAILDSARITILRTAAATAVAARYLARSDARTATIIGCGSQARAQLEALLVVRDLAKVFAFDLDSDASARFATEMQNRLGTEVVQTLSIDDAVAESEIVVTCTPARAPILQQHHLHDGLFIAAVGTDNPDKNELAPELLARCRVVPDITEQAASMGDLHHAIEAGLLTRQDIHGELADVVCGRIAGRRSDAEVFVFDSTGTALQDVVAASVAFSRAVERGIGLEVVLA
ncbi:MAG: ornithine cyclodeaminase family protein [Acidobacteriota bacterium]